MTTFLAYIDARPFLFVAGLPLFILLAILVCRLTRVKLHKIWVAAISSIVFTGLFLFFLTGYGPYVYQTEMREYRMTWEIQQPPSNSRISQSSVILSFADFPGHFINHYSDELAQHLEATGKDEVTVEFEVTLHYGKVAAYSAVEAEGLNGWQFDPEGTSGGGVKGEPENRPGTDVSSVAECSNRRRTCSP